MNININININMNHGDGVCFFNDVGLKSICNDFVISLYKH